MTIREPLTQPLQVNAHLRIALKRGVASGVFKQVKGVGASGSFKLGDKAKSPKKKAVKKPKTKKGVLGVWMCKRSLQKYFFCSEEDDIA